MQTLRFLCLFGAALVTVSCAPMTTYDPLRVVITSDVPAIRDIVDAGDVHEVQILFSRVIQADGRVQFQDFEYQLNDQQYFYPASTVKLPVALLALEKIDQQVNLDRDTPFRVEGDTEVSTIASEVRRIFAVSDNPAFNRLFEFLGQDHIQGALAEKNVGAFRINHRLSTEDSANLQTRSITFSLASGEDHVIASRRNAPFEPLEMDRTLKGDGYFSAGELISEPMDFSAKNYLPISTMHNILKRVIFPEAFEVNERFHLSPDTHRFVLEMMSVLPRQAGYDAEEYADSYGKFLMFGDTQDRIPEHIRIYNKIGQAYGYLTDSAYIKDLNTGVEFLLTATVHVNENRIFNDDHYDYEELGIPFLAELGRQIYQLESSADRTPVIPAPQRDG